MNKCGIIDCKSIFSSLFTSKLRNSDYGKQKWDMLVMMLSLVNAVCVPLSLSFEPKALETQTFQNLNFGIDFFFFIDIFISFRTVFVDDLGNEYEDSKIITREYL